tara:strand:+ start:210 stop:497 length:288 start_codon:yes stop_codon:yes gene_type:complete
MTEINKVPESLNMEYRFVDREWKQEYVLARIADAERTHFEFMVDRLDENHADYPEWVNAIETVIEEVERLKHIYRQLGGSFGAEFTNVILEDSSG